MPERNYVRFSEVIRCSDNRIEYLQLPPEEDEDEDIISTYSDESIEELRWNLKPQLPPSPPRRRRSLVNSMTVSADPPSPPTRRRSFRATKMPASTLPPSLVPQRRRTMDGSILYSPRQAIALEVSARKSLDNMVVARTSTVWFPLMSGDNGDISPPVMPTRQPSVLTISMIPPTSPDSVSGECSLCQRAARCGTTISGFQEQKSHISGQI